MDLQGTDDTNKTQTSAPSVEGAGVGADTANINFINNNPDVIVFPPTHRGAESSMYRQEHDMFPPERPRQQRPRRRHHDHSNTDHDGTGATPGAGAGGGTTTPELMGPLLRRKKVVSMPLGLGGEFFVSDDVGGPRRQLETRYARERQLSYGSRGGVAGAAVVGGGAGSTREKQHSLDGQPEAGRQRQVTPTSPGVVARRRTKQNSFMDNLVRRKQISLDLLGPNDFFAVPTAEEEEEITRPPSTKGEIHVVPEDEELVPEEQQQQKTEPADIIGKKKKKLFAPLRFSAPLVLSNKHSNVEHGPSMFATTTPAPTLDEETTKSIHRQARNSETLKLQLSALLNKIDEEETDLKRKQLFLSVSNQIAETQKAIDEEQKLLLQKLDHKDETAPDGSPDAFMTNKEEDPDDVNKPVVVYNDVDDRIIYANRSDKIKAGIVFLIMLTFTVVVCTWQTHIGAELHLYGPVGLACVTECPGNLETRDFFHGHNHFMDGQMIQLIMNIDPNSEAGEAHAVVEIVGDETGEVKAVVEIGPVSPELRVTLDSQVRVDFVNPEEHHIINVKSTNPDVELSFTLAAEVRIPLANYSVIVAACIMVVVYAFILVEVIHRTLVAIFGSMIALLFLFIMSGGMTESIKQIMLSMEWSTLGLLFGMMLLVGELSHTGIFEWCAVRLLVASRGSFNLLMVLLGVLTAVASAFLDNVTTMLLVAPVTIDMCSILGVDPRPYLIGEVLLSNVGGTATLIGDPPNIIIGTSYEEIDFVGFIINVLPAIFIFIIPATVVLILWIYRYYFSSSKMRVLDTAELKRTYPIYDQPRLMIAGTATGFTILIFFLHSVHHKDTAWIALFAAFITIAFTNPHDVQDALRNHVEWDTLLFFAGLFVLVEACAHMGLLETIGRALASFIEQQPEESQLAIAITLVIWVSAIVSAFLDNIPYTATMIPVVRILADELETLDLETLAWALSFGACLGGNGTLLGASANIVTAGISKNKGFDISFLNFLYPGMLVMVVSVAIANIYMLVRYVWI